MKLRQRCANEAGEWVSTILTTFGLPDPIYHPKPSEPKERPRDDDD